MQMLGLPQAKAARKQPAAAVSHMDWTGQDVAHLVMQHVPLDDKIFTCREVCTAWLEAADNSITELDLVAKTPRQALYLARLLLRLGGKFPNLHTVRAAYEQDPWICELPPCLSLAAATAVQQLTASGLTVSLQGVAGTHAVTHPDLSNCTYDLTPWSAQAVHLLAQLQHLRLQDCWHVQAAGASASRVQRSQQCLPGSMLQHMASLTALCIGGRGVNRESVALLGHLTSLKRLELLNVPYLQRDDLVPTSALSCLTLLHVTNAGGADMDAGLDLSRLTRLEELCLVQPRSFDAAPLADLRCLSRLQLNDTHIASTGKHAAAGMASLVSALEGASCLLSLDLRGMPLAAGDLMAMFSDGRPMTQLQGLLLGKARYAKRQFQLPTHQQLDLASIETLT